LRYALGAGAIAAATLAAPTPHGDGGIIVPEGVLATADIMSLHQEEKHTTTTIKYVGVPTTVDKLKPIKEPANCVLQKKPASTLTVGELIYIEGHPSYITSIDDTNGRIDIKSKSAVEGQDYEIEEPDTVLFELPKSFIDEYYAHIVKAPSGDSTKKDTVELIPKEGGEKIIVSMANVAPTAWDNMMYQTFVDGKHHHHPMPQMTITYLCGQTGQGVHVTEAVGGWRAEVKSWYTDEGDHGSARLTTDAADGGSVKGPRMTKPSTFPCGIM
jgi:hypothetical protein